MSISEQLHKYAVKTRLEPAELDENFNLLAKGIDALQKQIDELMSSTIKPNYPVSVDANAEPSVPLANVEVKPEIIVHQPTTVTLLQYEVGSLPDKAIEGEQAIYEGKVITFKNDVWVDNEYKAIV